MLYFWSVQTDFCVYSVYGLITLPDTGSYSAPNQRENVHIAQIRTWIPTPYFCIMQESESESGNVISYYHNTMVTNKWPSTQ